MKTITLPQPLASMVVAGVLDSIPNIWGNIIFGEKIYIYASELMQEFLEEEDYNKPLHRKVYNEMCLGNIPDYYNDFPTECYVGYVRVGVTGTVIPDCYKSTKLVFTSSPYRFKAGKYGKNSTETELERALATKMEPKRMRLDGYALVVPVGEHFWDRVNDPRQCRGLCLFWEDYMYEYAPSIWDESRLFSENKIQYVEFQFGKKSLEFCTDQGVGQSLNSIGDGIVAYLFSFGLEAIYTPHGGMIPLPDPNEPLPLVSGSWGASEEKPKSKTDEYKLPRPTFISTPMGCMTRWKRKR